VNASTTFSASRSRDFGLPRRAPALLGATDVLRGIFRPLLERTTLCDPFVATRGGAVLARVPEDIGPGWVLFREAGGPVAQLLTSVAANDGRASR
jgi:hypothetical protein